MIGFSPRLIMCGVVSANARSEFFQSRGQDGWMPERDTEAELARVTSARRCRTAGNKLSAPTPPWQKQAVCRFDCDS